MNAFLICSACFDELEIPHDALMPPVDAEEARQDARAKSARCPVCGSLYHATHTKDSIHADLVDTKTLLDKLALRMRMLASALKLEKAR